MTAIAAPRVCHLTSVHGANDVRIVKRECRSLAAAGYEVHLVAPAPPPAADEPGLHVHYVRRPGGRVSRVVRTTPDVLSHALRVDAPIYHVHDVELLPVALRLVWSGRRVIYDIHEDVPRDLVTREYLPDFIKPPLARLVERGENFVARRCAALVTATEAIARRFRPLNPRTVVVNNYPVREPSEEPPPIAWESRDVAVAYAGAMSKDRGLLEMVQAMGELPPDCGARLDLAGSFSPIEDRAVAARLSGWSRVREHGQVTPADVSSLLGRVRAGIVVFAAVPNNVEARPNKLFEYMAAGIPVVASDFPLWREIVEGAACGLLVDPSDPKAIARAITYLLTHASEAEAMGRRGRQAVEQRYNWSAEESTLLQLYADLTHADEKEQVTLP